MSQKVVPGADKLTFVAQDEIWKNRLETEWKARQNWSKKWGFLTTPLEELLKREGEVLKPPKPKIELPAHLRIRPVTPVEKYIKNFRHRQQMEDFLHTKLQRVLLLFPEVWCGVFLGSLSYDSVAQTLASPSHQAKKDSGSTGSTDDLGNLQSQNLTFQSLGFLIYKQVLPSPPVPKTTAGFIGWRSTIPGLELERNYRIISCKGAYAKQLKWPEAGIY